MLSIQKQTPSAVVAKPSIELVAPQSLLHAAVANKVSQVSTSSPPVVSAPKEQSKSFTFQLLTPNSCDLSCP